MDCGEEVLSRMGRYPVISLSLKSAKQSDFYTAFTKLRDDDFSEEFGFTEAFGQIRDQRYEEGVLNDGFFSVKSYGICFCKKSCIIGKYDETYKNNQRFPKIEALHDRKTR